jgi:nucleotide-binding universal stress UspA family protein
MIDERYAHVLVPTRFSPECRAAYRAAFAAARSSGAAVTLFHVLPPPNPNEYSGLDAFRMLHLAAERKAPDENESVVQAAAERTRTIERLRAEVPKEWAGSVDVRFEVGRGLATSEIARHARATNADLIVVGGSRPGRLPGLSRHFADRLALATDVEIVRVIASL